MVKLPKFNHKIFYQIGVNLWFWLWTGSFFKGSLCCHYQNLHFAHSGLEHAVMTENVYLDWESELGNVIGKLVIETGDWDLGGFRFWIGNQDWGLGMGV